MEVQRIKEILTSPQQFTVTYEGDSVWIDNYDDMQNLVTVHSIQSGESTRIPADRLHEQ